MNVALLGASVAEVSELAARLRDELHAAGVSARLKLVDAAGLEADSARFDVVLLLGLEHLQQNATLYAADEWLRASLHQTRVPFQVVCGSHEEKLQQALGAIYFQVARHGPSRQLALQPPALKQNNPASSTWVWLCDKCSDPECEHRLLSDLLARRQTSRTAGFKA